ncbi:MAG: hypothetical protein R3A44_05195 [Caldilineaceae bacterium]
MPSSQRTLMPPAAVGSPNWYEERWRTRWATLRSTLLNTPSHFESVSYLNGMGYSGAAEEEAVRVIRDRFTAPPWQSDQQFYSAFRQAQQHNAQSADQYDEMGMPVSDFYAWPDALTRLKQSLCQQQRQTHATDVVSDLLFFADAVMGAFLDGLFHGRERALRYLANTLETPSEPGRANLIEALRYVVNQIDLAPGETPANFALRRLMEQISIDLKIVQDVVSLHNQTYDTYGDLRIQIADEFARRAIEPAMQGMFLEPKEVMTYLNQQVQVRLLPYHDTILIGVPFAAGASTRTADISQEASEAEQDKSDPPPVAADVSQVTQEALLVSSDYLAIPHEVGHLLFRHGYLAGGQQQISAQLQALHFPGDWRLAWLEELFADAYGCMVAGPISVLGFQEHLADGLPADEHGDLGQHPFASIRPLIQTEILRTLAARKIATAIVPHPSPADAAPRPAVEAAAAEANPAPDEPHEAMISALTARIMIEAQRTAQELTVYKVAAAMRAAENGEVRAIAMRSLPPSQEAAARAVIERILREYRLRGSELSLRRITRFTTGQYGGAQTEQAIGEVSAIILELIQRAMESEGADDSIFRPHIPAAILKQAQADFAAHSHIGSDSRLAEAAAQADPMMEDIKWMLADYLASEVMGVTARALARPPAGDEERQLRKIAQQAATHFCQREFGLQIDQINTQIYALDSKFQMEVENETNAIWLRDHDHLPWANADLMMDDAESAAYAQIQAQVAARLEPAYQQSKNDAKQGYTALFDDCDKTALAEPLACVLLAREMAAQILTESARVTGKFTAREQAARHIVEDVLRDESIADDQLAAHILAAGKRVESELTFQHIVERILNERAGEPVDVVQLLAPVHSQLQLADLLDAHWQALLPQIWPKWVERRWLGTYHPANAPLRSAAYGVRGVQVSGFELVQALQPIINSIVDILSPLLETQPGWTARTHADHAPASDHLPSVDNLHQQYIAFAEQQILKARLPTVAQIQAVWANYAYIVDPIYGGYGDGTYESNPDDMLHTDPGYIELGEPPQLPSPDMDANDLLIPPPSVDIPGAAASAPPPAPAQLDAEMQVLATLESEQPPAPSVVAPEKFGWLTRQLTRLEAGATLDTLVEIILFMGWSIEGPTKHGP